VRFARENAVFEATPAEVLSIVQMKTAGLPTSFLLALASALALASSAMQKPPDSYGRSTQPWQSPYRLPMLS
jgi:hypothetical protein